MVSIGRAALASFFLLSTLTAEALTIAHDGVSCIVAERFPRVEARFDPLDDLARARVYFRPDGGSVWYYVPMAPVAGTYYATLPKPRKNLKKLNYYVEALDKAFAEVRSAEYTPEVGSDSGVCAGKATAGALASAAGVLVGGPPGAPALPAGFSASGVTAASAGAAAGAAAGAGGIGTTAIVVGAAAAAAGGVAIAAGKGGGSGTAVTQPSSNSTPVTTSTTTTTLAPLNVTGQWVGTAPDGFIETSGKCAGQQDDASLTLTQSGSTVNGTYTYRVRVAATDPTCEPVGSQGAGTVAGAISSGTFSGTASPAHPGDNPTSLTTTALNNNRMVGTWTKTGAGGGQHAGSWSVNRQ